MSYAERARFEGDHCAHCAAYDADLWRRYRGKQARAVERRLRA